MPAPGSDAHLELQKTLPGTAPSHRCHVFLNSPIPPAEFSERYTTPLQRELLLRVRRLGGIVSLAWYNQLDEYYTQPRPGSAVAFSELGGRLDIPSATEENLDEVVQQLKDHMEVGRATAPEEEIDVYVCTHGARDCRCGDMGGRVADALRREARRYNDERKTPRIRIGEIGHVGGHKYAANVLVYPQGEWLGLVRPEDAPRVIEAALDPPLRPLKASDPLMLREHWRGRMGLGKDEQIEAFERDISR
ncbi:Sucrase/ferredoxin-like-domain-containing protein [Coprinopsis sp. MPI-PUGE-AT-0042]|nr:Sucrase/ferredoxin-like-domain-containing protein [Coprinopsis sp. MPI-PUGE-AT-0042]